MNGYDPLTGVVETLRVLTRDDWQVRTRLDPGTVARYRSVFKGGCSFPPIEIVAVDGVWTLIDGWHRLAAAKLEDVLVLPATVVIAGPAEAAWLAAKANLAHGLPLKAREHRNVFRAFIRAGMHRKRKCFLSYRDIAGALGGVRSHGTLWNWMKKDFPGIAEQMAPAYPMGSGGIRPTGRVTPDSTLVLAYRHLDSLQVILQGLPDGEGKQGLIEGVKRWLGLDQDIEITMPF